jgi:hypothetical protein
MFSEVTGSATVAAGVGVTGRLVVKGASINTKMKTRDAHSRGDDFSAGDRFSDIVFEIDRVTSITSGLRVTGRRTVRERTVWLEFPAVAADLAPDGRISTRRRKSTVPNSVSVTVARSQPRCTTRSSSTWSSRAQPCSIVNVDDAVIRQRRARRQRFFVIANAERFAREIHDATKVRTTS